MSLHNFIRDSHREDFDFVHWENGDTSHGNGDDDEDESPDDSSDDSSDDHAHGGYTPYEPRGDRAMEGVRDYITNEMGRGGRLPY
ncbi:hypothetical protein YC2023_087130 [Brassica napus]